MENNLRIEHYTREQTIQIETIALSVATVLGSYLNDMVIVGGLVPTLLIPHHELPEGADPHVGTMDLDLGLDITIFDKKRYAEISESLRSNGFEPDTNDNGNPSRQRWRHSTLPQITIDFLIQPTSEADTPGGIKNLEPDFAAFIIPGLELAFNDPIEIKLSGKNVWGEDLTRTIKICNPGVFIVLKALTNQHRRKPKDAYDLYYLIRNFGTGVEDVAFFLKPLRATEIGADAIEFLREEFAEVDGTGPKRVAQFLGAGDDPELKADVVGYVAELLRLIEY